MFKGVDVCIMLLFCCVVCVIMYVSFCCLVGVWLIVCFLSCLGSSVNDTVTTHNSRSFLLEGVLNTGCVFS